MRKLVPPQVNNNNNNINNSSEPIVNIYFVLGTVPNKSFLRTYLLNTPYNSPTK